MNRSANSPFIIKPLRLVIVLAYTVCVAACNGGAIRFEAGNSAQVSVDENTSGVFWKTLAREEGKVTSSSMVYKLTGIDAAQFSINATSGELTFKQPADFEAPFDADKNNEYLVDVEASVNGLSSVQNVRVKVKDVSKPVITLLGPKLNENVGTGDSVEIDAQVRFYDAESNASLTNSDLTLNTSSLIQDGSNPQLWSGKVVVPEGGLDLSFSGRLGDGTTITSAAKLFNKRNAINPSYLKMVPGGLLYVFGSKPGIVELNLNLNTFFYANASPYIVAGGEEIFSAWDFNSQGPTLFLPPSPPGSAFDAFFGDFFISSPFSYLSAAGDRLSGAVSSFTDVVDKRLISVARYSESGIDRYHLFAQPLINDYRIEPYVKPLWVLPREAVRGTFKFMNIHGSSKTYIVADERLLNGAAYTMIQGFGEDGSKRFEAKVGADISNLAVNEAEGIVYVAENHSTTLGKLKTIDVASGEVKDLIYTSADLALGAYSTLYLNAVNQQLYIGDNVSDSIFVVDLMRNAMSALSYANIPTPIPLQLEFGVEN